MPEIKYEITESLGVISETSRGWTREVNMISWNGREPKLDIRYWKRDGSRSRKLGTLSTDAARKLCTILSNVIEKEKQE